MAANKMQLLEFTFILIARVCLCKDQSSITQTVYGFLDFTTTIGNTVMVFSPQSAPLLGQIKDLAAVIETKPINSVLIMREKKIQPTKPIFTLSSEISGNFRLTKKNTIINGSLQASVPIEDNLLKANYNLLSRQPAEYAEETYRVVNIKQMLGRNVRDPQIIKKASGESHPVGLVTKIDETMSRNGVTTIHRTSVIGTYISGKYAQVLQSSDQVFRNEKSTISPTRSLKTIASFTPKSSMTQKENLIRHSGFIGTKSKTSSSAISKYDNDTFYKNNNANDNYSSRKTQRRKKSKIRRNKTSRSSVNKAIKTSTQTLTTEITGRKSFRPKTQSFSDGTETSTNLFLFKLNRTPGRWQYKTSPKPRVVIRKPIAESQAFSSQSDDISSTSATVIQYANETMANNSILEKEIELFNSLDNLNAVNVANPKYLIETINVEISTPSDFRDVYYEIVTIRTPYIFQAGAVKKTRSITVTSTLEKTLEPELTATSLLKEPLIENILAPSVNIEELLLDTSVATLAPIYLTDDSETPHLETTTEIYSVLQKKLKTEVLPVIHNNHTSYLSLINTYDMTNLITATKTLSFFDSNQFPHFKSLTIFNSNLDEAGSELNLELDFDQSQNPEKESNEGYSEKKNADLEELKNKESTISVIRSSLKESNTQPASSSINYFTENFQKLALLNLFKPSNQLTNIISTHPVIKVETIFESFVVPLIKGMITSYRTLSKSIGTVEKTEYMVQATPLVAASTSVPINPFLVHLPQKQFHVITSSVVQETVVTNTNSKILKLTFGAKTAYTTLFSTNIVPTLLTSIITTSVSIPETANFPGFFPNPYQPFPYLG